MGNYIRFSCLIIFLINLISCQVDSKKTNQIKKKELTNYLIEISGKNDFAAQIDILKPKAIKSKKNIEIRVKVLSKTKTIIDTSFKNSSLEELYSHLMPVLMMAPYEISTSVNFKFENKKFVDVDPVEGSEIDTTRLVAYLNSINLSESVKIDLEKKRYYKKPRYTIDSPEAKEGKIALEKSLKSIVNLKYEDQEFKMDKDIFATWLHLDTAMKVKIETDPMQKYLQKIAEEIETPLSEILETYEKLDSTQMEEIVFSRLNINNQINEIIKLIPKGSTSSVDLIMTQRGLPKGIKVGHKDFVEVSISEQKLWLFKGGNLLLETDVVTGNKRYGRSTPPGNYSVLYKVRNKVLRGRGYASFVSYWMPFYGGYGLHDANWRRRFGSSIYESSGSHGCVNIPSKLAPIVYNNVEVGTPVIIW